jgi:hypothetical protein
MDPDANLKEQLEIAKNILGAVDHGGTLDEDDVVRLAELVEGLDEWIRGQGFLPKRWSRRR